jgi:thioredoxin reductase
MSVEENKATFRRYVEGVWIAGNLDAADEMFAEKYVSHQPSGSAEERTPEDVKGFVKEWRSAFMPGVFAAGDVRHRSVKGVASAVGEGAIAIQLVHEYFVNGKLSLDTLGSIPRERSGDRQDPTILSAT